MKEHFKVNQTPADDLQISMLLKNIGALPSAFLEFLRETNGSELGVTDAGGDCLILWAADEISQNNENSKVQEYLPLAVAIGSDGGDDAILLDKSKSDDPEKWPVVRVGFGALDPDEFVLQATSFSEWASLRFRLKSSPPPEFDLPSQEEISEDVDKVIAEFPEGDEPF